jgi:hypothetical protein
MRSFYNQPLLIQWTVALFLLGIAAMLVGMATWGSAVLLGLRVDSPSQLGLALLVALVLFLQAWLLVLGFLATPFLRLAGVLCYYSPFLIVARVRDGQLGLHGALPFDYLLLFRWCDRGRPAVSRILLWYVEGLMRLARETEQGQIAGDTQIAATSYIFSSRAMQRLGFRTESGSRFALGGIVTFPTQFLTYSFARGRCSLPPVQRACKATITASELCSKLVYLQRLHHRFRLSAS